MPDVIIYTTNYCPYCVRAKNLLERKGLNFSEIDVTNNNELRAEMEEKSGGMRTVPQTFINGKHVGGSDDLYRLEKEGQLDDLLATT